MDLLRTFAGTSRHFLLTAIGTAQSVLPRRRKAIKFFCLAALTAALAPAHADQYPSKPVRIVVPYSTGGGTDVLARLYAQKLKEAWGQSVVVENRPGGDGLIGTDLVAHSAPDGYNLVLVVAGHVINPSLKVKMPYDVLKDFTPVTLVATSPWVVIVNSGVPAKNISELIALAKAQPGKLSFGSSEPSSRLAGEQFRLQAGADIQNIPYKGGAQIMTDMSGGHLQLGFTSVLTALQHNKSEKLRVLAVSGKTRSPSMPDIPTATESGLTGYETLSWYGLYAPAGTPREVVNKIQQEIARISAQPDVKARLLQLGAEPSASKPEEFAEFTKTEFARYAKLIKDAGIQPD